jgi:hypothetical protein
MLINSFMPLSEDLSVPLWLKVLGIMQELSQRPQRRHREPQRKE